MKMVCPQCRETYENQLSCPRCGVKLTFLKSGAKPASSGALAAFAQSDAYRQVPPAEQTEEQSESGARQVLLVLAALGGAALAGFLAWWLTNG